MRESSSTSINRQSRLIYKIYRTAVLKVFYQFTQIDTTDLKAAPLDENQDASAADESRELLSLGRLDAFETHHVQDQIVQHHDVPCIYAPEANDKNLTTTNEDMTQTVPNLTTDVSVPSAVGLPVSSEDPLKSQGALSLTSMENNPSDTAGSSEPTDMRLLSEGLAEDAWQKSASPTESPRDTFIQIPSVAAINGTELTLPVTLPYETTAEPPIVEVKQKHVPIVQRSNSAHFQTSVFIRSYEIIDLTDPKPEEERTTPDQTNFEIQIVEGPITGVRSRTRSHTIEQPDWALAPEESQRAFGPMTRSKTRRGVKERRGRKPSTFAAPESSSSKDEPTRIVEVNGKWARGTGRTKVRGRGRA
jgi:hypothetical protein